VDVATTPSVEKSLSTAALSDIAKSSSPQVSAIISQNTGSLTSAITNTLNQSATQALVRADIAQAYNALTGSRPTTINWRPVILRFTASLHQANATIPVIPSNLSSNTITIKPSQALARTVHAVGSLAWIEMFLGVTVAFGVARFAIWRRRLRPWYVGITVGVPGVLLIVVSRVLNHVANSYHSASATTNVLVRNVTGHADNALASSGVIFLVVDAVIVAAWIALRWWRGRSPSPSSPTIAPSAYAPSTPVV